MVQIQSHFSSIRLIVTVWNEALWFLLLYLNIDFLLPYFNIDFLLPYLNIDFLFPYFNIDFLFSYFNIDFLFPYLNIDYSFPFFIRESKQRAIHSTLCQSIQSQTA